MGMPSFTKIYHHEPYPAISPTRPELSAKDKVVLVTGAASGVGEATAIAFAEAGASAVVLCGRRKDPLEKLRASMRKRFLATVILAYPLDISREDDVKRVFEDVEEQCGPLDVVVNSAGHLSDGGAIAETTLANFWESFEVTVKGGFLVAQHFLRHKSKRDPVLISFNSLLGPMPATAVTTAPASYASSKCAQSKMIEYVASENAGTVRAYSVHPGSIVTEMSTKSVNMTPDPAATRASLRWDDVNLPGHFSVWLASSEGKVIPSGRYLWAHWDVDELKQRSKELFEDPVALTLTLPGWPWPVAEGS